MPNEKAWFVVLVNHVQQFEAHRNQFFADIYQFVVVTAQTDALNSTSIDFHDDDDNDDRQNQLLYPLHMRTG